MKRTHTNWSDNSKHSLWLSRRKKLQIVDSLGELFLFVAYWTMIPIFCWSNPDFSIQLSGRSEYSVYQFKVNDFIVALVNMFAFFIFEIKVATRHFLGAMETLPKIAFKYHRVKILNLQLYRFSNKFFKYYSSMPYKRCKCSVKS